MHRRDPSCMGPKMTHSYLVEVLIDEDGYAQDAGNVFAAAEAAAAAANAYPVVYPEPYNTVGCGYGVIGGHIERLATGIANDLGLDWDCCHQTNLLLTLYCGTPQRYAELVRELQSKTEFLRQWVVLSPNCRPQSDPIRS